MPEMEKIYTNKNNKKKRRKKRKENLAVAVVSGLLPWKGDAVSDIIRKIVFLMSVCALAFAAVKIFDFYFGTHEETAYSEYWKIDNSNTKKVTIPMTMLSSHSGEEVEVEILEKYRELWEVNPEFVGFLSIDPYINYPVPQSQGDKADDWYLNHNFKGLPTENGTVFADKYGEFTPFTRPHNTIIHGHNLITKNNFQPLMNYRDSRTTEGWTFLKENPIVKFDTLYEVGAYKIFSVFQINTDDVYGEFYKYWTKPYFNTKDEFYEYVTEALDRSQYHTGVDLEYGDELLTLSTCDFSLLSNIRLVIVARRVRPGESMEMDTDKFINNRENNGRTKDGYMKYKMFDAYYKMSNSNKEWAGRLWDISWVNGLDEYLKRTGH